MFTGIIESLGEIIEVRQEGSNSHFKLRSSISNELKVDQSVAHDGVCLTVTKIDAAWHAVTAVAETLSVTNLNSWKLGRKVNLERSLKLGDRIDGHMVQGHVDRLAECIEIQEMDGSHVFKFRIASPHKGLLVEKGSICVNGISLTAFSIEPDTFKVAIIPYTFEHSSIKFMRRGDSVNLEFDILGKYIQSLMKYPM